MKNCEIFTKECKKLSIDTIFICDSSLNMNILNQDIGHQLRMNSKHEEMNVNRNQKNSHGK